MARPTKLTPSLQAAIVRDLGHGVPVETAAENNGIDVATLYRWLDRGAAGEPPYAAFRDAVTRARARVEIDLVKTVRKGDGMGVGFGKARAATFMLERTRPHRYGQRIAMKVEDAVSQVLEVVRGICTPEDFSRVLDRVEALDREGGEGDASPASGNEPG